MKKQMFSLKSLLLAILVVPVLFMFTACGGGQLDQKASCVTSGSWSKSDDITTSYNTAIDGKTGVEASAYRFTLDFEMSGGGQSISLLLNSIIDGDDMATKIVVPKVDSKGKINGTETAYMYITGNKAYMDADGKKLYYEGDDVSERMNELSGYMSMIQAYRDPDYVMNSLNSLGNAEVSKSGNNYKIVGTSITDNDTTIYLNFDSEGKLIAFRGGFFIGSSTGSMTVTITMSAFDGEIEFPNFDGYKAVTA